VRGQPSVAGGMCLDRVGRERQEQRHNSREVAEDGDEYGFEDL